MLLFIAFVVAVIVWDGFKKKMRGSRKPTVRMVEHVYTMAACGCRTSDSFVVKRCGAHDALVNALKNM